MRRFDPRLTEANPDADRAAQCAGKKAFASGALAHRVARRRRRGRRVVSVYRCDQCHQFHIAGRGKED